MLGVIRAKVGSTVHEITDLVHNLAGHVGQAVTRAWRAHRAAMEGNSGYRQAFYAGGTALLSAGSARNLWMAVVGMLLALYVAVFGPIKTGWTSRPLGYWDDDEPYERW